MRTRIRVPITVAAVAAGIALFISTPGAMADQGQPVIAGWQNTEILPTLIVNTTKVSVNDCLLADSNLISGLIGCGAVGVTGFGPTYGLYGKGGSTGVYGRGTSDGVQGYGSVDGVFGRASGSNGRGVSGESPLGTGVYGKSDSLTGVVGVGGSRGVYGLGSTTGVEGGGPRGVYGSGSTTGVEGSASAGGTGVYGHNNGSTGIGVHGRTGGVGSGVFGEATANGVGVNGVSASGIGVKGSGAKGVMGTTLTGSGLYGENTGSFGIGVEGRTGGTGSAVYGQATTNGVGLYGVSATGTGVWANSPSGTALRVNGKATFSRSGIATVPAGASSLSPVSVPGMTASSMVIATAQQNGNVFVKAAVPAAGSFKLVLSGNAPVGGLKVAYFVLN